MTLDLGQKFDLKPIEAVWSHDALAAAIFAGARLLLLALGAAVITQSTSYADRSLR